MSPTDLTGRTSSPSRQQFEICSALPIGTTVLEASAGTGKTFTIAALAARYIAEGVARLDELMLVTFGRMATNELRMRVRERLVGVERTLAHELVGRADPGLPVVLRPADAEHRDEVEELLCTGDAATLTLRHRRIVRALSDFDAATIATTHEFCLHMLDGLGVLGNAEPNAVFVEHLSDLTREVVDDVYLRRYATSAAQPVMQYDEALRLANEVVGAGSTRLVPALEPDAAATPAAERHAFAAEVREEVRRRKERGRLFSYEDMLTRLRDSLADPRYGEAAAERLRQRYRIVLVDEFQDTDPVQWDILRRAFHSHATLILIGDPKQAIYAFRGADVYSYLEAVEVADRVATLSTNWRSDQELVDAVQTLVGEVALGDPRIVAHPVAASQQQRRLSLSSGTDVHRSPGLTAPIRLRVQVTDPSLERLPKVGTVRPGIVADLVADVTDLLASGVQLTLDGRTRSVGPADIAVLVRKNERGEAIRDALAHAGVPAVLMGASSVFASELADQWLTLLTALEQPRQSRVREAALTCFLGWSFSQLVRADEEELSALSQRVRWWSRTLSTAGVAALLEAVSTDTGLAARLLAQTGGERRLTDLRHIGENLHAAMVSGQLGVSALIEWLRDRVAEARGSTLADGTRRLETDAESVQILTVHRSKGLQFPIVYLPEAWDHHVPGTDEGSVLRLHATAGSDQEPPGGHGEATIGRSLERVLDVGGASGPGRLERLTQCRQEEAGEELRLLYVALTRAQCQVITWWAASANTKASALHRLLNARERGDVEPAAHYPVARDPLSARGLDPGFSLERVEARTPTTWQQSSESPPDLRARAFVRQLDLAWRRTSYSALTAAAHGLDLSSAAVGSEPESVKEDDETALPADAGGVLDPGVPAPPGDDANPAGWDLPSPMADLPSGATFGTAVHAIFESVDFASDDLLGALWTAAAGELSRSAASSMTAESLAQGLLPIFDTPLGPLADQRRLRDVERRDQLPELTFELPLGGGAEVHGEVVLGQVAPLLRRHLATSDPLAAYSDLVEHPALAEQPLRGYLTGSIDAVLRMHSTIGEPRYLVVDYKTNWLGDSNDEVLTLGHYAPPRLAAAMMQAHYPLQALLYSVAVHRMLRWRQPGYDPGRHLGGVLYLFLRGMGGAETPTVGGVPCGVFSWLPSAALITDLSDLLDGSRA